MGLPRTSASASFTAQQRRSRMDGLSDDLLARIASSLSNSELFTCSARRLTVRALLDASCQTARALQASGCQGVLHRKKRLTCGTVVPSAAVFSCNFCLLKCARRAEKESALKRMPRTSF